MLGFFESGKGNSVKKFECFHPVSAGFFFLSMLLITVFSSFPLIQIFSLAGGIAFDITLRKGRGVLRDLLFDALFFAAVAISNPLFVHNGATPLFFVNGNAVTAEALLCGVSLGITLVAALVWFRCFNAVMTSDKLLFLFARLSPKISILLSSTLRFVPLFKNQAKKIRAAQKTMGLYSSESIADRLKGSLRVYSALLTWALENAVDTAASMKGRGFGLSGRTYYSDYRFGAGDVLLTAFCAAADALVASASAAGRLDFSFYPVLRWGGTDALTFAASAVFLALSFAPFIFEKKEAVKWRCYRLKI